MLGSSPTSVHQSPRLAQLTGANTAACIALPSPCTPTWGRLGEKEPNQSSLGSRCWDLREIRAWCFWQVPAVLRALGVVQDE